MNALAAYVRDKRVIVSCGAGGVGKTTVGAALALAGARAGRKVLVLTIDPSKRLAETLGVARNQPDPLPLPEARQRAAGVTPPGALSAWMLDPKLVADRVTRRLSRTPEEYDRLINNKVYQQVTRMIAGMQEYTAMEALHGFVLEGTYDLVVLDTPPSRNALNFLEAPKRLAAFFDSRIFRLFVPREEGRVRGTAFRLISRVLGGALGDDAFAELRVFLEAFARIFSVGTANAKTMRERLREPDSTFLLVSSPAAPAVEEAAYFHDKLEKMGLALGGLVLNRCRVVADERRLPDNSLLPPSPSGEQRSALRKLVQLAERERAQVEAHRGVLASLRDRFGESTPLVVIPDHPGGVHDLDGLGDLVAWLERPEGADSR